MLAFAKENNFKLTLVDDMAETFVRPGKQLTQEQLTRLIENSRNSGIISTEKAHEIIANSYDVD